MSEPVAKLDYKEPKYVPTINMDDPTINTAIALGALYVRPGQWVIRHNAKVRYLYTRAGGVHVFNWAKNGDTIISRGRRMASALRHYREAAAKLTEAEKSAIFKARLDAMSIWGRIRLIAKGA